MQYANALSGLASRHPPVSRCIADRRSYRRRPSSRISAREVLYELSCVGACRVFPDFPALRPDFGLHGGLQNPGWPLLRASVTDARGARWPGDHSCGGVQHRSGNWESTTVIGGERDLPRTQPFLFCRLRTLVFEVVDRKCVAALEHLDAGAAVLGDGLPVLTGADAAARYSPP